MILYFHPYLNTFLLDHFLFYKKGSTYVQNIINFNYQNKRTGGNAKIIIFVESEKIQNIDKNCFHCFHTQIQQISPNNLRNITFAAETEMDKDIFDCLLPAFWTCDVHS